MRVERLSWSAAQGWQRRDPGAGTDLVLYFGSRESLAAAGWFEELRALFPHAHLLGCSSASQIAGGDIVETGITGVALSFSTARVRTEAVDIDGPHASRDSGAELGRRLAAPDLAGVLVLSDGLMVNGSELTRGISSQLPEGIPVSGGLAADGALFERTLVGLDEIPRPGRIGAVGFYGAAVHLVTGSAGGWAEFGPRRRISHSDGNVLHALDGEPALDLYERYLGEEDAKALPSSALLFPLKVFDPAHPEHSVVRTILSVDREARTMTFAGDVPQGWSAQLMRGNVDRLVNGAADAARQIIEHGGALPAHSLALMVSCIGRRLLMGQRTIDEVEAAGAELGDGAVRLGFYSYGEICPHDVSGRGEMHNQTMTITAISEAA
jgi:hypothetical protein